MRDPQEVFRWSPVQIASEAHFSWSVTFLHWSKNGNFFSKAMLVRKPALRLCFLPFFKRNVLSFGGFFKVRMGERSVRIREVKGSNPSRSIKRRIVLNDTAFLFVLGSCFFNTAAHRGAIQASCYPMTSKTNCTTMVFKKCCITTRTKQWKSEPFLDRRRVRMRTGWGHPCTFWKSIGFTLLSLHFAEFCGQVHRFYAPFSEISSKISAPS